MSVIVRFHISLQQEEQIIYPLGSPVNVKFIHFINCAHQNPKHAQNLFCPKAKTIMERSFSTTTGEISPCNKSLNREG